MLSPEEKKERLYKVTGSRAAACLGMNPHQTPFSVWSEIMGHTESEETEETERGHMWEPIIIAEAANKMQCLRLEAPRRSVAPWITDKPDALFHRLGDDSKTFHFVVEAKSVGGRANDIRFYGDPGTSEVPDHHFVQAHIHLIHYPEVEACIFPALLGTDLRIHIYRVDRDEEVEQALMEELEAWHFRHVIGNTPPEVEAGDYDVIRKISKWAEDPGTEVDPRIEEWARLSVQLRGQIKDIERRRDLARAKVASFMGGRQYINAEWGRVTYKPTKKGDRIVRIYMKENE